MRNLRRLARLALTCALAPLALAALLLSAGGAQTQDPVPAPAPARFDAASIRLDAPGGGRGVAGGRRRRRGVQMDPQHLTIGAFTVGDLLATAYNLKPYQISGPDEATWTCPEQSGRALPPSEFRPQPDHREGVLRKAAVPPWMNDSRFDVTAETSTPVTPDQMRALLRPFLTEQFHLQLRLAATTMPAYALVVAKGGLKMQPGAATVELPAGDAPLLPGAPKAHTAPASGMVLQQLPPGAQMVLLTSQGLHFQGTDSMQQLADALTRFVDRPVLDATGITGNYPINLTFAPTIAMGGMAPKAGAAAQSQQPNAAGEAPVPAPRLFSVLRQQLGLQLVSRESRRLHFGQSRREGLRKSGGVKAPLALSPLPANEAARPPLQRCRSRPLGLVGPRAGSSPSGMLPGVAGQGPAPVNARTMPILKLTVERALPLPSGK